MKKSIKMLILCGLTSVCLWAVAQSCTGNTTNKFWHEGVLWCCTEVGDGSDWSCTDGSRWSLFSDLWAEWNGQNER